MKTLTEEVSEFACIACEERRIAISAPKHETSSGFPCCHAFLLCCMAWGQDPYWSTEKLP